MWRSYSTKGQSNGKINRIFVGATYKDSTEIMKNQMEKNMESKNNMESGFIQGLVGIRSSGLSRVTSVPLQEAFGTDAWVSLPLFMLV